MHSRGTCQEEVVHILLEVAGRGGRRCLRRAAQLRRGPGPEDSGASARSREEHGHGGHQALPLQRRLPASQTSGFRSRRSQGKPWKCEQCPATWDKTPRETSEVVWVLAPEPTDQGAHHHEPSAASPPQQGNEQKPSSFWTQLHVHLGNGQQPVPLSNFLSHCFQDSSSQQPKVSASHLLCSR